MGKLTFVEFSNIQSEIIICGVTYITVDKVYSDGTKLKITLRKSEMLLQDFLIKLKRSYNIPDEQIETLKLLIEEETFQKILENNIE